jgi:hypothetical protein
MTLNPAFNKSVPAAEEEFEQEADKLEIRKPLIITMTKGLRGDVQEHKTVTEAIEHAREVDAFVFVELPFTK